MRSNGVAGANSGRQAGGMQARQQLRHSEYLEASVAELADNFQAMLWTQQRRDPTAPLGQQQVVLMRQNHQQQQQQQQQNNNVNNNRRHTQHFGDFDYTLYGGAQQ